MAVVPRARCIAFTEQHFVDAEVAAEQFLTQ
jgi:hypothetical protein